MALPDGVEVRGPAREKYPAILSDEALGLVAELQRELEPTRAMWEHVLDSLKRRYRRREGVSDEDVAQVERVLRQWREPPKDDD